VVAVSLGSVRGRGAKTHVEGHEGPPATLSEGVSLFRNRTPEKQGIFADFGF